MSDPLKSTKRKRNYCCICSNFRGKIVDGQVITLHRLPSDKRLRKAWINRLRLVSPKFTLNTKNDRLCSAHFPGGIYTKENNVPSIFIINNKEKVFQSSTIENPAKPQVVDDQAEVVDDQETDETYTNSPLRLSKDVSDIEVSCYLHDYCGVPKISTVLNKCEQTACMKFVTNTASTQISVVMRSVGTQTEPPVECNTKSVGTQVKQPDISFEDIECDKSEVAFYTGLPNADTFYSLFDEMDDLPEERNNGRPKALRKIDEFFLVLIRLRLGLLIHDLAYRFHISKSTCSDIIKKWISYLSVKLSFLIPWPEREVIKTNLPKKFRKYPNCRVIIDCTEIYTQTPSSLQNKSLMYSHYKSHMTYKALVGISPNGMITFVSDLWTGSISDKQITKSCGILDLIQPGDAVMADKGFLIHDLLTQQGARLIIPPVKRGKFFRREIEETRRVANLRIYVEMAIQRLKNFRILQGVMPITLSRQASQIWKICASLTNLQPPLVLDDEPMP